MLKQLQTCFFICVACFALYYPFRKKVAKDKHVIYSGYNSPPYAPNYTTHFCWGETPSEMLHWQGTTIDKSKQICIFRNVCRNNSTWFYHVAPGVKQFGDAETYEFVGGKNQFFVRLLHSPSQVAHRTDIDFYVLVTPHIFSDNYGHLLGDVWKPIFLSMLDSGYLSYNNQIIYSRTLQEEAEANEGTNLSKNHLKVLAKASLLLSKNPIAYLKEYQSACFSNLLVVPPIYEAFHLDNNQPGSMRMFREYVYKNFDIQVQLDSSAIRVTVLLRRALGHATINIEELATVLQSRHDSRIVVQTIDAEFLTMQREVEVMANTDVLITAPGGASFSLLFLPDGAHAIISTICYPCFERLELEPDIHINGTNSCCRRMESHLWSKLTSYVNVHHFENVHRENLVLHEKLEGENAWKMEHPYFLMRAFSFYANIDDFDILFTRILYEIQMKRNL